MSSSPAAPPPPNYQPLADASAAASRENAQIARDQLQWAKDQYAENKPYSDRIKAKLETTLDESSANARKDRARYEDIYQPLEDKAANEANTYASDENKERMRGRAMGTVGTAFDAAGDAARRSLEGFGVDPSSTRMAALDIGVKASRAAAQAAAANNSDLAVEDRGRAMRDNAINVGKGYPGQVIGSQGVGTGAGGSGVGAQNSTYSAAAPALGNPTAFAGLSNQALGTWGNVLSNMYSTQMQGFAAQQNSSSGVGAALGGLAGLAGAVAPMLSDERVKENIKPVGKTKDGQTIYVYNFKGENKPQMGLLAQEVEKKHPEAVATNNAGLKMVDYREATRFANGGYVDPSLSPSGGAQTDDVPASVNGSAEPKAAIDVGEFVMPERTTSYYGTKFMTGLIEKADKAMGMAPQPIGPSPGVRQAALPV